MKVPGLPWVFRDPGGPGLLLWASNAGGIGVNILHTMWNRKEISNASTSVIKGCEPHSGSKVISRDMRHPEGGISVGIEGSHFCNNPLPPFPYRCSMWVKSPLEHPLRNSRLSLTQAHLSCGCPPTFAPV